MLEDWKYKKYALQTKWNEITKQQHKAIWKTYRHVEAQQHIFKSPVEITKYYEINENGNTIPQDLGDAMKEGLRNL